MSTERHTGFDHRRLLHALLRRVAEARGGEVVLVRCAWCERIRIAPDEWVEAGGAVAAHALDEASHGICPACFARLSMPPA
jgi:hypothetical protein